VVNAIMDACYTSIRSKRWEPVLLDLWRGGTVAAKVAGPVEFDRDHFLIKREVMPDGRTKLILKEKKSGKVIERVS
jgi:hypothetical protein